MSSSEAAANDPTGTLVGLTQRMRRVREFGLQPMIEGTARVRSKRALDTRTQAFGEAMLLLVGGSV
eukprot:10992135-Lingulodinium_polyedra.AAC.1